MNIYDIKKNTIMKKLKYVKLFESFLNEELSPETLQSFRQKAGAEAAKGDLDSVRRQNQASSAARHVSPLVKNAIKELNELMKQSLVRLKTSWGSEATSFDIWLLDSAGLNKVDASADIWIRVYNSREKCGKDGSATLQRLKITKDSYDILFKNRTHWEEANQKDVDNFYIQDLWTDFASDKKIIDKIKALVTLVQENEIAKEKEEPKKNWLGF
jgi:hypothetical protein